MKLALRSLACCLLLISTPGLAQVNLAQTKWGPAPAVFPKGAKMAVLAGDPSAPGIFVIRLKMPAGYRVPAHSHASSEYVTVVAGTFNLGMGDKLDMAKSAALSVGGFALAPANMNHFAFTRTGATIQIVAEGPFSMTYVNSADDPSKK